MNFTAVEKIADAVLYEGYILYPYRASAVKNRQRFNFGALMPEAYSIAERGTENWQQQTQCLLTGNDHTRLFVSARFLHLLARDIYQLVEAANAVREPDEVADAQLCRVEALEVQGRLFQTWQEAVERQVDATEIRLGELRATPVSLPFSFPANQERDYLRDADGKIVGAISRKQEAIEGVLELQVDDLNVELDGPVAKQRLFKLTARILNTTAFEGTGQTTRDEALRFALASAHTILGVQDGEFVSLLDTPEAFREAAATCQNLSTYPVLAGAAGARNMMLSSPIILYDYPEIAPESDGDLFDGTEIDEILLLRIMTLTDEEKREMRAVDARARRILERTETLPPEQLMKLHGVLRGLR
jgi:hydrogenase maturation protease